MTGGDRTGPDDATLRDAVEHALAGVVDPASRRRFVELGRVSGLKVEGGRVRFAYEVAPTLGPRLDALRRAAEDAIRAVPGVASVAIVLTAHRAAPKEPGRPATAGAAAPLTTGARHIIAVASGKGGVGKSTVAVNLAVALAQAGRAVGLLDADIYGPSVPRLLGLSGRPESRDGRRLAPFAAHGIKAMSMGFLVPEDTPMIWRGPMVMGAIEQLLRDVDWSGLDILVVDMPPGTGDAQLTLAQKVALAGAVIVSTPQDLALIDARKGLNMFRKVQVPVFGIVENMSFFVCPHCGGRSEIFGHGGAREEAARLGCDFLGEVPLVPEIRAASDRGVPIVAADPKGEVAAAFHAIAGRVAEKLAEAERSGTSAPRITVD